MPELSIPDKRYQASKNAELPFNLSTSAAY